MPRPILPERPVLVAPDSFSGTFRATQVAGAIGRGLERAGLMPPDLCPVADGGAGTADVLLPVLGGEIVAVPTQDSATPGSFALLEDGRTALVETATGAISSSGTGEEISAAVKAGAAVVVVAGGSAASDGGAGALETVNAHGGLRGAKLVILCPRDVSSMDFEAWAAMPGATLEPGARWVLDLLDFDDRMRAARAVVTGEGTLDHQTLEGGLVGEIGQRTRQAGVPLHAVVGRAELDLFGRRMIDLQRVLEATTLQAIEAASEQLGSEVADGRA